MAILDSVARECRYQLVSLYGTSHDAAMSRILSLSCAFGLLLLLSGCLVSPVAESGGPGSVTVQNTNVAAIVAAAQSAFAHYGYSPGPVVLPHSISFDRPAGRLGEVMFGSHGRTTSFRVRVQMIPIPNTHDFRLVPRISRIGNADRAGFESDTEMLRSWASQLRPVMRQIQSKAANAGPGQ